MSDLAWKCGYGVSQLLCGIDLLTAAAEVAFLLGRNGMGESATIKTLVGALSPTAGEVNLRTRPPAPCKAAPS